MGSWEYGSAVTILGARKGSLGQAVAQLLIQEGDAEGVDTYGPDEADHTHYLDVRTAWNTWLLEPYDHVVCTIGINLPDDMDPVGREQMKVNYLGVAVLMHQWDALNKPGQFVVISSNSAHIARSQSMNYCASKAALSMAVRAMSRKGSQGIYYAWEFGLLEDTPMTAEVADRVGQGVPLTRMPGLPNGIPTGQAARHVYNALKYGSRELNGCTLRLDAGEQ